MKDTKGNVHLVMSHSLEVPAFLLGSTQTQHLLECGGKGGHLNI